MNSFASETVLNQDELSLFKAIQDDNLEGTKSLLAKELSINITNAEGSTPLLVAARYASLSLVQWLIASGAKLDVMNKYAENALWIAASYGRLEILRYFLEQGLPADSIAYGSETALMSAIRAKHLQIVQLLLEQGVNVNARNIKGDTALLIGVQVGCWPGVKFLLDKGAEIDARNQAGKTPLFLAVEKKALVAVKFLLDRGAKVNVSSEVGETILLVAASRGAAEIINLLLSQYEVDVDYHGANQNTALSQLIQNQNRQSRQSILEEKGAKLLIEAGATLIEDEANTMGAQALLTYKNNYYQGIGKVINEDSADNIQAVLKVWGQLFPQFIWDKRMQEIDQKFIPNTKEVKEMKDRLLVLRSLAKSFEQAPFHFYLPTIAALEEKKSAYITPSDTFVNGMIALPPELRNSIIGWLFKAAMPEGLKQWTCLETSEELKVHKTLKKYEIPFENMYKTQIYQKRF